MVFINRVSVGFSVDEYTSCTEKRFIEVIMKQPKIVALLPIKAYSKRIPGKNFKNLGGKPLFRWVLDTLLEVPGLSQLVINTDAPELIQPKCPSDSRIVVRQRKPELCGEITNINSILADDISEISADIYMMTYATSPFLSKRTFIEGLTKLKEATLSGEADSLFSVTRRQSRLYQKDGVAINHDPLKLMRSQDLEPYFEENSCFYCFTPSSFAVSEARIGLKPMMLETSPLESIDIDEPSDWLQAELLVSAGIWKILDASNPTKS